jgi:hypothetical protein
LCVDLRLMWGLKKSYSSCWKLFNNMWHATCIQGNWGDSGLLVVKSQIGNLTLNSSFDHNLCFKYSNGSCEPILNIYVSTFSRWYNELLNPMSVDLYNHPLKIWESIGIIIPKWELIWECGGSFPHTFLHFREHEV